MIFCAVSAISKWNILTQTHTHTHTQRHTEFLQWELYLGVMGVYVLNQTFSLPGPLHICAIVPC